MALMRACTIFGILAMLAGASCFNGEPDAPLTSETFVGTYIYYSGGADEPHGPDELTLRADGTYKLIHKPSGRQGVIEEGRWQLSIYSYGASILLDLAGYTVRVRRRGATEEGQWDFVVDSCGPRYLIGRAGYPVWIEGKNVRLGIDDDLGEWYQKIE